MDGSTQFTVKGHSFDARIDVGTLPRLKSVGNITLDELVPKRVSKDVGLTPLAEFLQDPIAVLYAAYAICKPQIDAKNLTFDQFAELFEGEGAAADFQDMGRAVVQGIHDFFLNSPIPQPLRAEMVKRALMIGKKLAESDGKRVKQAFDRMEAKLMKDADKDLSEADLAQIDKALDAATKTTAGTTPESLELATAAP